MSISTSECASCPFGVSVEAVKEQQRAGRCGFLHGPEGIGLDGIAPSAAEGPAEAAQADAEVLARQADQDRRYRTLQRDARASARAFAGWNGIDQDGWVATCEQ